MCSRDVWCTEIAHQWKVENQDMRNMTHEGCLWVKWETVIWRGDMLGLIDHNKEDKFERVATTTRVPLAALWCWRCAQSRDWALLESSSHIGVCRGNGYNGNCSWKKSPGLEEKGPAWRKKKARAWKQRSGLENLKRRFFWKVPGFKRRPAFRKVVFQKKIRFWKISAFSKVPIFSQKEFRNLRLVILRRFIQFGLKSCILGDLLVTVSGREYK